LGPAIIFLLSFRSASWRTLVRLVRYSAAIYLPFFSLLPIGAPQTFPELSPAQ